MIQKTLLNLLGRVSQGPTASLLHPGPSLPQRHGFLQSCQHTHAYSFRTLQPACLVYKEKEIGGNISINCRVETTMTLSIVLSSHPQNPKETSLGLFKRLTPVHGGRSLETEGLSQALQSPSGVDRISKPDAVVYWPTSPAARYAHRSSPCRCLCPMQEGHSGEAHAP